MKIALTSIKQIASKKGIGYVVVSGISAKGDAVKAVIASTDAPELLAVVAPNKEIIEGLFDELPNVEIDFNEQGRAEGGSVLDDGE